MATSKNASKNVTVDSEWLATPTLWVIFRQPLQWLLLLASLSMLSLGGSFSYFLVKEKQKIASDLEFSTLEKKHFDLQEMRDLVDNQEDKLFFHLKEMGFYQFQAKDLGMAAWRIVMEEPLLNLQNQINLWVKPREKGIPQFNFTYGQPELKSQTAIKVNDRDYQLVVYQSKLTLQAYLMHEGYVLDLLQHIKNIPLIGLLLLQQCQLNRLQEKIDPEKVNMPNLQLNCNFEWTIARTEAMS
ncbi:hypothetical protein [Thioflexithrix psekupsensis]|uniref:Uncharacterized protein n=1 Tax=Thioflexithrix psekupsensis TaxID=1570016 RepID=A0A251X916_9GAMM|nr:hypothetical protein [Thioflexithrix psekupsensis]OUD14559.1 hypothetical protein TPSD3_09725 [Thioflexithrix psekupsensis]